MSSTADSRTSMHVHPFLLRWIFLLASSLAVAQSKNATCGEFGSCASCTSDLDSVDCVWCAGEAACVSSSSKSSTCSANLSGSCEDSYYTIISIVVVSGLLCICCGACYFRKYRRSGGAGYRSNLSNPLLPSNARRFLFRSSLEGEKEWMCIICGFDNKTSNKQCVMCGTDQQFSSDYKEKKREKKALEEKKKKERKERYKRRKKEQLLRKKLAEEQQQLHLQQVLDPQQRHTSAIGIGATADATAAGEIASYGFDHALDIMIPDDAQIRSPSLSMRAFTGGGFGGVGISGGMDGGITPALALGGGAAAVGEVVGGGGSSRKGGAVESSGRMLLPPDRLDATSSPHSPRSPLPLSSGMSTMGGDLAEGVFGIADSIEPRVAAAPSSNSSVNSTATFASRRSVHSVIALPSRTSILSPEKRQNAINLRRLNQLSLRQKSARRRRMWQRKIDPSTGLLTWMRLPVKEIVVGNAPFGYSPRSSFAEEGEGPSAAGKGGGVAGGAGKRNDSAEGGLLSPTSSLNTSFTGSYSFRAGGSGGIGFAAIQNPLQYAGNNLMHVSGNNNNNGYITATLNSRNRMDELLAAVTAAAASGAGGERAAGEGSGTGVGVEGAGGSASGEFLPPLLSPPQTPPSYSTSVTNSLLNTPQPRKMTFVNIGTAPSSSRHPINNNNHHYHLKQSLHGQSQQLRNSLSQGKNNNSQSGAIIGNGGKLQKDARSNSLDSFGDSVFVSNSPGYMSVFDEHGNLHWERIESGKSVSRPLIPPISTREIRSNSISGVHGPTGFTARRLFGEGPIATRVGGAAAGGGGGNNILTPLANPVSSVRNPLLGYVWESGQGNGYGQGQEQGRGVRIVSEDRRTIDSSASSSITNTLPASGEDVEIEGEEGEMGGEDGDEANGLFSYDLETIAAMTFREKHMWFLDQVAMVQKPWVEGFIKIEVRREHLLSDSHRAFMMLEPEDLQKWIRIQFRGEAGVDAGGLVREWFEMVTEEIFKPSNGLFTCNHGGESLGGTYHINPTSGMTLTNSDRNARRSRNSRDHSSSSSSSSSIGSSNSSSGGVGGGAGTYASALSNSALQPPPQARSLGQEDLLRQAGQRGISAAANTAATAGLSSVSEGRRTNSADASFVAGSGTVSGIRAGPERSTNTSQNTRTNASLEAMRQPSSSSSATSSPSKPRKKLRQQIQENHLSYFRFVGRFFGKAIMEQQTIAATLSLPLRKQMLSVPITFSDLEFVDSELYRNLIWMKNCENIEDLALDHSISYAVSRSDPEDDTTNNNNKNNSNNSAAATATALKQADRSERMVTYDLIENGSEIPVTEENKEQYLALRLRHRLLDSIREQLQEFLRGFYEVIPEYITVFDYQELELLMCGVPDLDLQDWIRNTEYMGAYRNLGDRHHVIRWFWLSVEAMSQEERVRLLQFVTGCSRLPAHGFKALQSNDGKYRKFNIQSVSKRDAIYPRAHTCFNKLDLPLYDTQSELDAYLSIVINMEATGFHME